jgi:AAA+ ATPase superfamily predicted ATPase
MENTIIGREQEQSRMNDMVISEKAHFWAVYGRRRVGKTFLIREFFIRRKCIFCTITGSNRDEKGEKIAKKMQYQLNIFQMAVEKTFFEGERLPRFKNWQEAFSQLLLGIKMRRKQDDTEIVIFLDELPWLTTRRSDLISVLEHIWNTEMQYIPKLRLIVSGSAASWMLRNVIHAKGGLHNRLTASFRLKPFSLSETAKYLREVKNSCLDEAQILELYMCIGGIPYYLSHANKTEYSASQIVGSLCFGDGELAKEFDKLFVSLFDNSQIHSNIVRALAAKPSGMTRDEILAEVGLSSGRMATETLNELEEAGFIEGLVPIHKKGRDALYRLMDEFCLFHCNWIERAPSRSFVNNPIDYWLGQIQSQNYVVWAGYAFENICLKHSHLIRKKMGFSAVACDIGPWQYHPLRLKVKNTQPDGAQIDLLFDRADKVISLAEMKYYNAPFVLSADYKKKIEKKISVFKAVSKTKKYINIILVVPFGLTHNSHSNGFISGVVKLEDLFNE